MEGTAALRNLKLLVGSGCLEFPKVMAGMDSLDKHVRNLFLGVSHIFPTRAAERLAAALPNPLLLKSQSRQLFIGLQQSHSTAESTITALQQILETTTPRPNPLLLCMRQVLFLQLRQRDGHDATIVQSVLPLSGTCFWHRVDV